MALNSSRIRKDREASIRFLRMAVFWVPFLLFCGLLVGRLFGPETAGDWYRFLIKPTWQPAPVWFAVVWTLLYMLMGLSLARLITLPSSTWRSVALWLFALQFLTNLSWTPLFFGLHEIYGALVLLIFLVLCVAFLIGVAWGASPIAAFLLVPYLGWLIFAAILNWQILILNPMDLVQKIPVAEVNFDPTSGKPH